MHPQLVSLPLLDEDEDEYGELDELVFTRVDVVVLLLCATLAVARELVGMLSWEHMLLKAFLLVSKCDLVGVSISKVSSILVQSHAARTADFVLSSLNRYFVPPMSTTSSSCAVFTSATQL